MLGNFVTRILILLLGYAYPAFECYKSLEKREPEIHELRYWCKYWILVGLLTVLERIGDVFVSWIPLYGEMKVAIFVYLWYPKTQGTGYVYKTLLQPYVSRHELDIDKGIAEFRIKAGDILVRTCRCSFQWIQTTIPRIFEALQQQFDINQVENRR
ncbi:PREDICTED: HVA22-like protein h isoform X2 [Tarenaya hassleriana]|uniref:HVA22-like protein h isoform X2 n=1 Tax=Tarenaya hassleriana TaxID=28532 RepID=UPI00053C35C6|nr:PREDICTED: HVA22-like protein h isoform X2 [Tarenaya hassleriana]